MILALLCFWTLVLYFFLYLALKAEKHRGTRSISSEVTDGIRNAKQSGYLNPDRFKY